MEINVYSLKDNSNYNSLIPYGSAIVSHQLKNMDDKTIIFFEYNKYNDPYYNSFHKRTVLASTRLLNNFPTQDSFEIEVNNLNIIAKYNIERHVFTKVKNNKKFELWTKEKIEETKGILLKSGIYKIEKKKDFINTQLTYLGNLHTDNNQKIFRTKAGQILIMHDTFFEIFNFDNQNINNIIAQNIQDPCKIRFSLGINKTEE